MLGLVAGAALLVPLVACSGTSEGAPADSGSQSTSAEFPITIDHAFGETVIEEAPERVAAVAWSNHEVPLALGVVPVGMSKATWGDDDGDGVLPWVEEQLESLGAATPVLFDETDGIDFEAVALTEPDVILASYSGLTQEEYETLSKIAPVVAYPDVPWGTSYEEMIRMNSTALGMQEAGDKLIERLHSTVETALNKHPEIKDKKFMFAFIDPADLSQLGYYTSHDTRPGFLESLSLPTPDLVKEVSAESDAFYLTLSSEQADRLKDVDVFVTYGDPDGDPIGTLQADPLLSKVPAIAAGHVAILKDNSPLAASANPSPLSIEWGVDQYFSVLSDAATR